jgi:hypothetical protein
MVGMRLKLYMHCTPAIQVCNGPRSATTEIYWTEINTKFENSIV